MPTIGKEKVVVSIVVNEWPGMPIRISRNLRRLCENLSSESYIQLKICLNGKLQYVDCGREGEENASKN